MTRLHVDRLFTTRSNATALMSTPLPNPMINPIARSPIGNRSARIAPSTSEDAATSPQPNAAAIRTVRDHAEKPAIAHLIRAGLRRLRLQSSRAATSENRWEP
jgi:hypothetical protein